MTDYLSGSVELGFDSASIKQSPASFTLNGRSSEWTEERGSELGSLAATHHPRTNWLRFDLAQLWHGLRDGTCRFREVFSSETRSYAVLERVAAPHAQPITARALEILERLLRGQSHKIIASELQVSVSTVTSSLQASMRTMGLQCRGSRAPVILTMAALAAFRPEPVLGRIACSGGRENAIWVVSVRRLDLDLQSLLSKAELIAVRQLVDGSTHAQIAGQRAVSVRTVANQLAAAFRKLGVSGRSEVVQQLIARSIEFRSMTPAPEQRVRHSDLRTDAHYLGGLGSLNGSQSRFAEGGSGNLSCEEALDDGRTCDGVTGSG